MQNLHIPFPTSFTAITNWHCSRYRSSQPCEDFILNLEFQSKVIYWYDINSTLGPKAVPTDYGTCCFIAPQIRSSHEFFQLSDAFNLIVHPEILPITSVTRFGECLQVLGKFLAVRFLFGKMLSLLWQKCDIIGLIFIASNGQILKNNLKLWSHCL